MYYPVAVEGGLVSMGDAHSAQGDSEFDGQSHLLQLFTWTQSVHLVECKVGSIPVQVGTNQVE